MSPAIMRPLLMVIAASLPIEDLPSKAPVASAFSPARPTASSGWGPRPLRSVPVPSSSAPAAATAGHTEARRGVGRRTPVRPRRSRRADRAAEEANATASDASLSPGRPFELRPLIDQEGRQWRSAGELGRRLRRDGWADSDGAAAAGDRVPWTATMARHTMMLRDVEAGPGVGDRPGRFVADEERWMMKYDALCRFHERRGHTDVPPPACGGRRGADGDDTDGGVKYDHLVRDEYLDDEYLEPYTRMEMYIWVAQQRYNYRHHNGTRMTEQRVRLLNDLNFCWDANEARWETQYQLLREYYGRHGSTAVRQNTTLGRWVYKQRWYDRKMKTGETLDLAEVPKSAAHSIVNSTNGAKFYRGKLVSPLTPERRRKLDAMGFVWDCNDARWEENYFELAKFKEAFNTTRVPESRYQTLGKWVRRHRAEWRRLQKLHRERESGLGITTNCLSADGVDEHRTFLTPERIEKLNEIGFEWEINRYTWDERFEQQLLDFKSRNGHVNVPTSYDDPIRHPKLGIWLADQRRKGRKFIQGDMTNSRHMSKERFDKLEAAGVIWDTKLAAFGQRVGELRSWRDEFGTLEVDSSVNKPLQEWVFRTKKEYRKLLEGKASKIDSARKCMLDKLGFNEAIP